MAFGSFICTNFGFSLDAKAKAGKQITISRIALGSGSIGTASVYDVTKLKTERLSLSIQSISHNADEAIITAMLSNDMLEEGFHLREIGLMAIDPDTKAEGVYLYNRDSGEGEYLPDKHSAQLLKEYLRIRCKSSNAVNIAFEYNGNPIDVTKDDLNALRASLPKIRTLPFNIPPSAWRQDIGGYYCDIADSSLRETDHIDIGFDEDGWEAAISCGLQMECELLDGLLRIRVDKPPDVLLTGECIILTENGIAAGGGAQDASEDDIDALFDEQS